MLAVYTNSSKHLINWNSPKVGNCALIPFISLYEASIEHGLVVHKVTRVKIYFHSFSETLLDVTVEFKNLFNYLELKKYKLSWWEIWMINLQLTATRTVIELPSLAQW